MGTAAENVVRDYPTNVRITARESGLAKDTVFLCFQLRSLDPQRFVDTATGHMRLAGRVGPERMGEIDEALRLVLGL